MWKLLFFAENLHCEALVRGLAKLVNAMDPTKLFVTVQTMEPMGAAAKYFQTPVRLLSGRGAGFTGLLSPQTLYRKWIREEYDVILAVQEGVAARVISGCTEEKTRLFCFVDWEGTAKERLFASFRTEREAQLSYERFERIFLAAQHLIPAFCDVTGVSAKKISVLPLTKQKSLPGRLARGAFWSPDVQHVCTVVSGMSEQSFRRLLVMHRQLLAEGYWHQLYLMGVNPPRTLFRELKREYAKDTVFYITEEALIGDCIARCEMYLCPSAENNLPSAAGEAVRHGTPVISVPFLGAAQMLGGIGFVCRKGAGDFYRAWRQALANPMLLQRTTRDPWRGNPVPGQLLWEKFLQNHLCRA